jgi:dolichyl-phosphate-mannose--protein O-mannosyl transferase
VDTLCAKHEYVCCPSLVDRAVTSWRIERRDLSSHINSLRVASRNTKKVQRKIPFYQSYLEFRHTMAQSRIRPLSGSELDNEGTQWK